MTASLRSGRRVFASRRGAPSPARCGGPVVDTRRDARAGAVWWAGGGGPVVDTRHDARAARCGGPVVDTRHDARQPPPRGPREHAMTADDPLAAALAAAGLAGVQPGQAAPAAPAPERAPDAEPPAPPARWPDGAATGVGSMPGTDPREAAAVVTGELPVLTALPELPARGVGADMIGRTAGLLVDIAVEVRPSGYRVTAKPGRDQRRAVDLLRTDLDA